MNRLNVFRTVIVSELLPVFLGIYVAAENTIYAHNNNNNNTNNFLFKLGEPLARGYY